MKVVLDLSTVAGWEGCTIENPSNGDTLLCLDQVPVNVSMNRHELQAWQWEHPLHVGRKNHLLSIWRRHSYFLLYKSSSSSLILSPKRNSGILSSPRWSDSNLLSEISSFRVNIELLVKRAYCSPFVPMNVGAIFCRLKKSLGSGPPICRKWCLFDTGFREYLTTKRKT